MRRPATILTLPALLAALACGSSDPATDPGAGPADTPPLDDVQFDAGDVPAPVDAADVPVTVDMGPDVEPCLVVTSPSGFRDNCNGTVTDTNTGLMWEKGYTWATGLVEARGLCESAQTGGHEDWHLPTIDELRTLILGCPATYRGGECPIVHDAAGSCDPYASAGSCPVPSACNGCGTNQGPVEKPGDPSRRCYLDATFDWQCSILFWSSSQIKKRDASDGRSWYVTFYDAAVNVQASIKDVNSSALRCVRGP